MADSLTSNVAEKLVKKFADRFTSNSVLLKTIDTQEFEGKYTDDTGGTVSIKRPHQAKVSETTKGDLTSETASDIQSGKISGAIQNRMTVFTDWNSYDEALNLNGLDTILDEYAYELAVKFEVKLGAYMLSHGGLAYGTPGTAADAWSDVAGACGLLKSVGVPSGPINYVVPPMSMLALADAQNGIDNQGLVKSAWEEAQVRNFAGTRVMSSDALSTRTCSTATDRAGTLSGAPTVTYVGAKDTMTQVLAVTGLNGGATFTLKAGEVIEFTGSRYLAHPRNEQTVTDENGDEVQWRCVVTADAALTSGAGNVTVTSAGIYEATGQYNNMSAALASADAFNVLGTTGAVLKPNMCYHKKAFSAAFMNIPKLPQSLSAGYVTKEGISIRVSIGGNFTTDTSSIRFDIHPIFATMNPLWAMQAYGK